MKEKIIVSERIVWIDWAKSLCMFLVILGHSHIQKSDQYVIQFIYSFHMMLFFFLSGILCKRDLSIDSLKKDVRYLILPYYTFGILLIGFDFLRARTFDLSLFLQKLHLLIMGDDAAIGPIWFLPSLFICKQLFLIIKKLKRINQMLYIFFVLLTFVPVRYLSFCQLNMPFFSDSALCGLPFFVMGYECCFLWKKIREIKWYNRLSCAGLLGGLSIYICKVNGFVSLADCAIGDSVFLYYINALFMIFSICILCMFSNKKCSFILTTSYGSIFSLFFHGIPMSFFNYYLPVLLGYHPFSYSLFLAFIYSMTTYCMCYLMIKFLDSHYPKLFGLKGVLRNL